MDNNIRPIHPGEQWRDELDQRGMSGSELARKLHIPAPRINPPSEGSPRTRHYDSRVTSGAISELMECTQQT